MGIEEPDWVDDHKRPYSAILEHFIQVSSAASEARGKRQGTRFCIPRVLARNVLRWEEVRAHRVGIRLCRDRVGGGLSKTLCRRRRLLFVAARERTRHR